MKLEIQVLRDMVAFSRPVTINLGTEPAIVVLPPGWGADYMAQILVEVTPIGRLLSGWIGCVVRLSIDNMPMGIDRPGAVYPVPSDVPSAIVHFGAAADPASATLGGWHTVTLRCVER